MPYIQLSANIFNCDDCPTRCDGKTVDQFDFEKDVNFSESIENEIIDFFNKNYPHLISTKTTLEGYPDIEIRCVKCNHLLCLAEVKGQARTFMSIGRMLKGSGLTPSETLCLNLSDLERYFKIFSSTNMPIILIWSLMRRPCITGPKKDFKKFFYQNLGDLKTIRTNDINNSRRFRRATGKGDVVNGEHKGVVVNYHFSINELEPGLPNLVNLICPACP